MVPLKYSEPGRDAFLHPPADDLNTFSLSLFNYIAAHDILLIHWIEAIPPYLN
jgi:hypothetical protein